MPFAEIPPWSETFIPSILESVVGIEQNRVERFTKWSKWNSSNQIELLAKSNELSDFVRVIMRTLVDSDVERFESVVKLNNKKLLAKALEARIGSHDRTLLHGICMHPLADNFTSCLRQANCSLQLKLKPDLFGLSPLHILAMNKSVTCAGTIAFIKSIDDSVVNDREESGGCTPLHLFLLGNHEVMSDTDVKTCIKQLHSNLSAFAEHRPPILVAASNLLESEALRMVKFGHSIFGWNISVSDRDRCTAMHIACQHGNPKLVSFLLTCMSPPSRTQKDITGASPVHAAAAGGTDSHVRCLQVLYEKLSSSDYMSCLKDDAGWPPLLYALFRGGAAATVRECIAVDETIIDPTWGEYPQLKFVLHLVRKEELKEQVSVSKLLKGLLTVPEFFGYLNRFISIDISVLGGTMKFLLEEGGAYMLSIENKMNYLIYRCLQTTREAGKNSERRVCVNRPDAEPGVEWLKQIWPVMREGLIHGQRVDVRFINPLTGLQEAGYGIGPTREFFSIVGQIIQNPLFCSSPDGQRILPASDADPEANMAAGALCALSLISGARMDMGRVCYLLWDYIVKGDLEYLPDIEELRGWDRHVSNSLMDLRSRTDNEVSELFDLPGTQTKDQYIAEQVRSRILTSGMTEFRRGFLSVIKEEWLVDFFNHRELSIIMGSQDESASIDINDWRLYTQYSGYTSESCQVKWFWELVACLGHAERQLLLMFVTGMTAAPLGGFSQMKTSGGDLMPFTIRKLLVCTDQYPLPTAATCFNLFNLPAYPSREILNEKLVTAIRFGSQGFEFA
jgi:ankyrin repeat protein